MYTNNLVSLLLTRVPYPAIGGDRLKNFHLLKILNRNFKVNLIVVTEEEVSKDAHEFLKSNCHRYTIIKINKWHCRFNALASLWKNGIPMQVAYYYFKGIKRKIDGLLMGSDIVVCCLIRLACYTDNFHGKKILDMTDSISINYKRSAEKVQSVFWKFVYRFEAKRLAAYEKKYIGIFNTTIFINYFEMTEWSRYGNCVWLPNGVSSEIFDAKYPDVSVRSNSLAFLGKMDYQPNIDAMKWLAKNVLPLIKVPCKLIVIGSNHEKLQKQLNEYSDTIQFTGFVEDPYQLIASCGAFVAPMQTGGGMQNKILEALATGQIVITTRLGAEPIIGARNGTHLLVVDDAQEMAALIQKVLTNRDHFTYVGVHAKRLISEKYTWNRYEGKMIDILMKDELPEDPLIEEDMNDGLENSKDCVRG